MGENTHRRRSQAWSTIPTGRLPSWPCRFDPGHPLSVSPQVTGLGRYFGGHPSTRRVP